MPGGKRNPFSMTQVLETIGDVVQNAKTKAEPHSTKLASVLSKVEHKTEEVRAELAPGTVFVDLSIQFIGASGLPKLDVVGTADPYFIAKIDKRISFVSTVIRNNLAPVWNEPWRVKNVPSTATLYVTVMDKDEGAVTDDYVGEFETSVAPGAKEAEIIGPMFRRDRGTFWLKIDSTPSTDRPTAIQFPYLFDGPIRYSTHFSPTAGLLTNLDDARLYSTWKMYIRGVPLFFRDQYQHWNRNYKAAQSIFQGPASVAVRSGIQAGHRMLYARTAGNRFGHIENPTDILEILHGGVGRPGSKNASIQRQHMKRVKPAIYTYIISADDDSFRFSETGAAFFVDFASKHALHANCAESVRYSGEFHPRPQGGWQNFSDDVPDNVVEWELVIDNNSGTYAPDRMLLPELRELLEYNFPGFKIFAWDREDPKLKESVDACRDYAVKFRGVGSDELQPTAGEGEETLMHRVSLTAGKKTSNEDWIGQEQGGDGNQGRYNLDTNPAPLGGSLHSQGQPPPISQYGQDAYSSYRPTAGPSTGTPGQAVPSGQSPPRPLRPSFDGLPRTSTDYYKNMDDKVRAPPPFPEPSQYIPPSSQPQYAPLRNPSYGYEAHANASHTPPPQSQPPPLPARPPGSRPTSQDYAALPPGCAQPSKFLPGESEHGTGSAYGGGMMSRYDPSRM